MPGPESQAKTIPSNQSSRNQPTARLQFIYRRGWRRSETPELELGEISHPGGGERAVRTVRTRNNFPGLRRAVAAPPPRSAQILAVGPMRGGDTLKGVHS